MREERGQDSSVDQKLMDLSTEFVKYFGALSRSAESETDKYQKTFFVSLLPSTNDLRFLFDQSKIDLEQEKKSLDEIYQRFGITRSEYQVRLEKFFKETGEAFREFKETKQIGPDGILRIISVWKIHDLVQKWEALNKRLEAIYAPRDNFLETINQLLQRKKLSINEKNEVIVETDTGKIFPLMRLSSGEKQLIIILGEALLQMDKSWIYIADEPELSLHVNWQEKLISSIRKLNSNAQILFATHSP